MEIVPCINDLYFQTRRTIQNRDYVSDYHIIEDLHILGYREYSLNNINAARLKWTDFHTNLLQIITPIHTLIKAGRNSTRRILDELKSRDPPLPPVPATHVNPSPESEVKDTYSSPPPNIDEQQNIGNVPLNSVSDTVRHDGMVTLPTAPEIRPNIDQDDLRDVTNRLIGSLDLTSFSRAQNMEEVLRLFSEQIPNLDNIVDEVHQERRNSETPST